MAAVAAPFLAAAVLIGACGGDSENTPDDVEPTATAPSATRAPAEASPTSEAGGTSLVDACELVTKAEVEAAVSGTVLGGESEQVANLASCSFGDPEAPIVSKAGVSVFAAASANDAEEVFSLAKSNAADVEEVAGLGQDAYWDGVLGTLQVLHGTYEVSIDVSLDEGVDEKTAAEQIAEKALSRLP